MCTVSVRRSLSCLVVVMLLSSCASNDKAILHIFESQKASPHWQAVYPLCQFTRPDKVISATREYGLGEQEIPVFVARGYSTTEYSAEAYFMLPTSFPTPGDYIFQIDFDLKNEDIAMVLIADMNTGVHISKDAIVKLRPPMAGKEFNVNRLCRVNDEKK